MNAPADLPMPLPTEPDLACDVAIIGSGFAGLGMGIRLKQSGVDDFLIFENLCRPSPISLATSPSLAAALPAWAWASGSSNRGWTTS